MEKRYDFFIKEITPILKELNDEYLLPGLKSEEGLFYCCDYCDMECGGHERHDSNCISDLSRKTLIEFGKIDKNSKFLKDVNGNIRTNLEEIQEITNRDKTIYVLENVFKPNIQQFIPSDLRVGFCCLCNFNDKKLLKTLKHKESCVQQRLCKCFSNLFDPDQA